MGKLRRSDIYLRNGSYFFRRYSNKYLLIPQYEANGRFNLYEVHIAAFLIWEYLSVRRGHEELAHFFADLSKKKRIDLNLLQATFSDMIQNGLVLLEGQEGIHETKRLRPASGSYANISEYILELTKRKRLPLICTFELTHRCNLNCAHCYAKNVDAINKAELPTKSVLRILDEIVEAGCISILFTGGEIFLRRDFSIIYEYAKRCGFIITLYTNGTLINHDILALLKRLPPHKIEISIYGASKSTYESITRLPGSFNKFIKSLNVLREQNVPFTLKTMLLKANKNELNKIRLFAKAIGTRFYFDSLVHAKLDSSLSPLDFRLSIEESLKFDHFSCEKRKAYLDFASGEHLRHRKDRKLYSCQGGITGFNINPKGQLSVCILSSNPSYNLRQSSFKEAWKKLSVISRFKYPKYSRCSYCNKYLICRVCPAISKLESGNEHLPVDYLCTIADSVIDKYGLV